MLQSLTHSQPHLIREAARAACRDRLADPAVPYVVLVVPLLVETGAYADVIARIAVVDCPETLQIHRVRTRSGLDEARIRSIMASQVPRDARRLISWRTDTRSSARPEDDTGSTLL